MSPLLKALRAKFRTPHEVLRKLGIDAEVVLRNPRLAFDQRTGEHPLTRLHSLLASHLRGHELDEAHNLLRALDLDGSDYDFKLQQNDKADEIEAVEAEDDSDEELKPEPETKASRRAKVSSFLKEKGCTDAAVAEFWRIVEAEIEQARERRNSVAEDRRTRRKLATDAAGERNFFALFPEAARLTPKSLVELGIESAEERFDRPQGAVEHIAMDANRADDWLDRLTRRIGIA